MSNPLTSVQLADNPVGLWVLDEAAGGCGFAPILIQRTSKGFVVYG